MAKRIPKKTVNKVKERSECRCEICGSNDRCQIHHIVLRSQRVNHDLDNLIMLCWNHHHGDYGVHGKYGKELNMQLKKQVQQKYFDKGLSESEVRYKLGGKLYL